MLSIDKCLVFIRIRLIKNGSSWSMYTKWCLVHIVYVNQTQNVLIMCIQVLIKRERKKSSKCNNRCFMIGDMNSRPGPAFRNLHGALGYRVYSYPILSDAVLTSKDAAAAVLCLCVEEHLLVVNNLRTSHVHLMSTCSGPTATAEAAASSRGSSKPLRIQAPRL